MPLRKKSQSLAIVDDVATLVLLDIYYLGINTHKINKSISNYVVNKKKFEAVINKLLSEYLSEKESAVSTAKNLIQHINVYLPNLKIPSLKELQDQLISYLHLLNLNSGFAIQTCFRYVISQLIYVIYIVGYDEC